MTDQHRVFHGAWRKIKLRDFREFLVFFVLHYNCTTISVSLISFLFITFQFF